MSSALSSLSRSALVLLQQLNEDAGNMLPYRGCEGLAKKTAMAAETVRDALESLQLQGYIRLWHDGRRVASVEVVPTGLRLPVEERRGGQRGCCRKKVSRETELEHWIPEERT
jgi:hypothetical protein